MTLRHRLLDLADWHERTMQRHGLTICVGLIVAAFLIGVWFVGPVTVEERCQFVAASPSAATAPASPASSPGSQAGAPSHCEVTP